jgi:hypothetical protein
MILDPNKDGAGETVTVRTEITMKRKRSRLGNGSIQIVTEPKDKK